MDNLKRTPLYATHLKYGGKIIDFAGWALPVQFTSIIEEHHAVRKTAGLFDVSDMGELTVEGPESLALLQLALTNDISQGYTGKVIYSPMCNEQGGVVDDLLVYCLGPQRYLLVINAGNIEKDFNWVAGLAKRFGQVTVKNVSSEVAEVALQGPNSQPILAKLTAFDLAGIRYYHAAENIDVGGVTCMVSRTGYTGEDGFELYCEPDRAAELWDLIMEAGDEFGLVPAGLGCRDTLRFEASMPLYGQELDDQRGPLEAGLGKFVAFGKGDFVGREALLRQREQGPSLRLVGFEMLGRGIPRTGYPLHAGGQRTGYVTTGSYAPSLDKNLGLGFVAPDYRKPGTEIEVEIRGRNIPARVVRTPFYRREGK
ncbi:MAG: glycine cleavage system aminomethyltransferase GcvT [Bacillota bacterium]